MNFHVGLLLFCALLVCGTAARIKPNNQCPVTPWAVSANDFGSSLITQINERGNLFISPLSIYVALAMVYLGSGGRTAEQIETAFKLKSLGLEPSQFHVSLRDMLNLIKTGNDEYTLLVANGLFLQSNFSINPKYIKDIQSLYAANVELVNFLGNGRGAMAEINKWAADNTNNKIQKFLQQPLQPSTKLAILNAVYFKGIWKKEFDKQSTVDGAFYLQSGKTKQVKFMVLRNTAFRFFEDLESGYKFLELPYKGDNIKMLLTLPKFGSDISTTRMDSAMLCSVNSNLSNTTLDSVIIPKFQIEYKKDLKQDLLNLGISDAFSPFADLTGIRKEGDLFVSEVQHAAVLEVNEKGSEAAAVTGIFITRLSASIKPEFIANHPFLLHIFDKRNGVILFSGQIVHPVSQCC